MTLTPEGGWEPIEGSCLEVQYLRGSASGGHRLRHAQADLFVVVPPHPEISTSRRSRAISDASRRATGLGLSAGNALVWVVGFLKLHHGIDSELAVDIEAITT